MIVKTFEGMNIKDVIASIKKEFGREAVILETKEKTLSGSQAKIVEVKAAVPEAPKIHGASMQARNFGDSQLSELSEHYRELTGYLHNLSQTMATKQHVRELEEGLKDLKLLMIDSFRHKAQADYRDLPLHLQPIYEQLMLTGVSHPNLLELINHLKGLAPYEEGSPAAHESASDYYKSQAIRYMLKKLQIYPPVLITKGHTLIHAFVGPMGSGKTATIVKLASYLQKKDKAKILLAAYDPAGRIAASEPLRVYAKILDVPFLAIEEPSQLEKALYRERDIDVVLIDTAGRYPKSEADMSELKALKNHALPIDFHLVLSLTEKDLQLDRAVSGYAPLGIASLLFTRLDASWTYGDIYNLTCKWSLPLSFFAIGPNIPHDIEKSSRERVMERLFGL